MARAQELADWDGFKKRAAASKKNGLLRGIGLATYIEACGNMGADTATITLEQDGGVTALMGSQSSGQGHATSYAQIVADHLGLPPELRAHGAGRHRPHRDRHRHRRLELDPVRRRVACRRDARSWRKISSGLPPTRSKRAPAIWRLSTARCASPAPTARSASPIWPSGPDATPDKLTASDAFDPPQPTYPNGTHVAEVEIDEATGATRIVNYVVVDDFGVTLNPLLLAGQVHGGAVQGIGQALMEQTVYDKDLRPARHRVADGLRAAARVGDAGLRVRDAQRAVQGQSAGREGRGGGRRDRLMPGGHERGPRRAVAQPTASAISTCRPPRSGSGPPSRKPG